ncbi:50S ribosomal protein L7ae-like protein [Aquibacillus salsiterrae]|uniref:50S ribosomal protein L7ae-like protein n=1 Tax=Aquibacillus salsiterrae TaxID=2950439 RepID=A0A9X4AFL4_9BACI|nr:50S ribosomal protein L7ae-like protein [Aquibacillus salsiterrae]MDC3417789.1 50S ribosomal protein L7ae-like protein [Aquibacillus salsiterrae]
MSYEKVAQVKTGLIIGTKQTLKAIKNGEAVEVIIADDADQHITSKVSRLAKEYNVPCQRVDSKKKLGQACGIDVGTAAVAIKQ